MSIYVVEPVITDNMLIATFEYLCICEVKKRLGMSPAMHEGCQDGYAMCLSHLLGESDEDVVERAFDREKTYLHVIERIVNEKLASFIESTKGRFSGESLFDISVLEQINESTREAVDEYHQEHPGEFSEAIRCI
jgi:hypothetical protein